MSNKLKRQQGFSLVELMVAMVISLFLSAGVFSMFSMSATNVTTTSQFNQLQENGRIALALIERDVSQVGFMADMTGNEFILNITTQINAVAVANDCVGGGVNNATLPNNFPAHFRWLWGYESGIGGAEISCLTDVVVGTDVLQIKRLVGPSTTTPNDSTRYYLAANSNESIFFTGGQVTPVLSESRFWEYQHHIYYIRNDGDIPVLRRKRLSVNNGMGNEEQLVEGIENIRILYGVDNDGDTTADAFMPAANVTTGMWDQVIGQVVALRIYVLVRSTEADTSYTNDTVYTLGDKTFGPFGDNFRRKMVSTTIVFGNPMPPPD